MCFRDAADFDHASDRSRDFSGFGETADDLTLILRIAGRPQSKGLTEPFRYVAARYLNKMVGAGSGPGWWLAPGPTDRADRQRSVIATATPGSLMEWLLVMRARSDTPRAVARANIGDWEISQRDRSVALDRLTDLIRQRGTFEPGLEWQAAASACWDVKTTFSHAIHQFHRLQRKPAKIWTGSRPLARFHKMAECRLPLGHRGQRRPRRLDRWHRTRPAP